MGILKKNRPADDVERRVRDAIAAMRPLLRLETVEIALERFDASSGVAFLRLEGDCPDCDMSASALATAIEAHLRQRVAELRSVKTADATERERHG